MAESIGLPFKKKLAIISVMAECMDDDTDDSDINDIEDVEIATVIPSMSQAVKCYARKRHRQHGYILDIVCLFRSDEFKIFFRVTRCTVEYPQRWIHRVCIDRNITGIIERAGDGGCKQKTLHERLLMTLWFMASKDKYSSIADRFGMSESTAHVAIRRLLEFINHHLRDVLICWPTEAEQIEMQGKYEDLKNFPGVAGMVDGTHIPIRMPSERGIDYYNRKYFYSVVLQAVCREDLRFTNVFCGYPGKVHDARIFRHSPLYTEGPTLCGDGHILGDSAYPNLSWCLTPFRDNGHLTPAQIKFNITHASIRCTIERAFGLLKGRFPRLQHLDQRDVQTIVTTILAACVLHNVCVLNNDEIMDVLPVDDLDVPQCRAHHDNFDANSQERGANKRLAIARNL